MRRNLRRLHILIVILRARLFDLLDLFVVLFDGGRRPVGDEVEVDGGEAVGGGGEAEAEGFGDGGEGLEEVPTPAPGGAPTPNGVKRKLVEDDDYD